MLPKHGIEVRYSKSRRFKLLSYAVWVNGNCQVSHETTAGNRRAGMNIQRHLQIEQERNPLLEILN